MFSDSTCVQPVWLRLFVTAAAACAGGFFFSLLNIPVPWLLGPMAVVLFLSKLPRAQMYWPQSFRNTGLIIVGYTIGLAFTMETFYQIGTQLPMMIGLTMLLLLFSGLMAFGFASLSGVSLPTALTGSIPGGLSQMVTLAEEEKQIDITIVTFMQVTRIILIMFLVPVLAVSPLFTDGNAASGGSSVQTAASWDGLFPSALLFLGLCLAAAWAGQKLRLPTSYMLAPMLVMIAVTLIGLQAPALPVIITNGAQLLIGTYFGLLLRPEQLQHKARIGALTVTGGVVLIAGAFSLSLILEHLHHVSPATALLSLAPGGMDQMGIIGREVNADISIVICYQLFRILFIFIAVPPILRWLFKWIRKREALKN
ncbi:AbrB family transcriptional regulator [Marinococcus sp. PL1-022]|uniref:AbrB family transcriptional regulator n=1 Tax=Marinococcus sp. PL1-022 TaxID=3095363 RepID=UPI0029C48E56|nr:AbrB family transcriptional regulator [Marinococcus sp. PL1-022]MDX6153694.1 AbrB family transcriptional regulator [Marinococcus sp. PL1-022]